MENQKEEKENKKNLGQRVKSKIIIILLIFLGFWIGWDLGAYTYFYKYLPYAREKETGKWVKEYDKYIKDLHKNDYIGGNTPEETIDLFIAALKKGDMDLASKYFVAEEQEVARKKVEAGDKIKIIEEIEYAKKNWHKNVYSESSVEFWYNKEGAEISRDIGFSRVNTSKWKIDSINIYYLGF